MRRFQNEVATVFMTADCLCSKCCFHACWSSKMWLLHLLSCQRITRVGNFVANSKTCIPWFTLNSTVAYEKFFSEYQCCPYKEALSNWTYYSTYKKSDLCVWLAEECTKMSKYFSLSLSFWIGRRAKLWKIKIIEYWTDWSTRTLSWVRSSKWKMLEAGW